MQSDQQRSGIKIHSGSREDEFALHPMWTDSEDHELKSTPFTVEGQENNEAIKEINSALQRVLDDAPSDAGAELSIIPTERGIHAKLSVSSSQGEFVSEIDDERAVPSRFIEIAQRLIHDVRTQLKEWKRSRVLEGY